MGFYTVSEHLNYNVVVSSHHGNAWSYFLSSLISKPYSLCPGHFWCLYIDVNYPTPWSPLFTFIPYKSRILTLMNGLPSSLNAHLIILCISLQTLQGPKLVCWVFCGMSWPIRASRCHKKFWPMLRNAVADSGLYPNGFAWHTPLKRLFLMLNVNCHPW
jgi:hypothetical protein